MIALRKFAPAPINDFRWGQLSGQCCSTFQPPPSITKVTTTFGGELDGEPGNGVPARSVGQSAKPINAAVVGAMSASVTRVGVVRRLDRPGACTTSGTRSRYIHTEAWLVAR